MFGFFKKSAVPTVGKPVRRSLFSTDYDGSDRGGKKFVIPEFVPPVPTLRMVDGSAMDSGTDPGEDVGVKPWTDSGQYGMPEAQLSWYVAQGFIGYQMCALLSQHWLVYKACAMPGRDAIRNGYDLSGSDGVEVTPQVLAYIRKVDKRMRLKWHLQEYTTKGRIFGIRIMMFKVASGDPDYYKKPFNIDGVTPGSYKGMVQIDPYWIVPELISQNLVNPDDLHFYEPEFWRISGKIIHRSHLVIFTTGQVPDVLKPSYYYGGVSVPQRIYERIYGAERTANEAPQLAMTKRLNVMKVDITKALANEAAFTERMQWANYNRDNFGTRFIGEDDEFNQFDLSLTDFDNVIMTQYQIVAAIAEVPGTKLLGTQPKGFNSTGQYEESSYHEFLESMEENDLDPVLDRHYAMVIKSEILPRFKMPPFELEVSWNELDAMTAQEQATVNASKAATDAALVACGSIESADSRNRLIADPDSGYSGLEPYPDMPDVAPNPNAPQPSQGGAPGEPPAGSRAAAQAVAAKLPAAHAPAQKGA